MTYFYENNNILLFKSYARQSITDRSTDKIDYLVEAHWNKKSILNWNRENKAFPPANGHTKNWSLEKIRFCSTERNFKCPFDYIYENSTLLSFDFNGLYK